MTRSARRAAILTLLAVVAVAAIGAARSQLPVAGAGALLRPARRHVDTAAPPVCQATTYAGAGVNLAGWSCRASTARRGTLVHLHGVGDNRASGAGEIGRFGRMGLDVVLYDSRAHGESGGDVCTYGFFEKQDLRRILDTCDPGPIVLLGTSLGAGVALQTAAVDPRVTAVVAAETFSDLRTVATERAPFFFTSGIIASAFRQAERDGRFEIDAVSPVAAAAKIAVPVMLIHGEADVDTPPDHSRRVFAALRGPKRLVILPGVGHNQSLGGIVWDQIEQFVLDALDHATQDR